LLPSADEAIEDHGKVGALVAVQSWARAGQTAIVSPLNAATAERRVFIFITVRF
jgi:hypothetical protein